MAGDTIRVVLIDDHLHVHETVAALLSDTDDIVLVGHGSNGEEAVRLCASLRPDVVLMDVMMPRMTGIEASKSIHKNHPEIRILVLSSFQDDESVHAMLKSGATGYVLKDSLANDLANTIRTTFKGKSVFSTEVAERLLNPESGPGETFGLTTRELEVLRLMAQGLNNNEIAAKLVISQSTVKFHISNLIAKIGVETRAEAIVQAAKKKLI